MSKENKNSLMNHKYRKWANFKLLNRFFHKNEVQKRLKNSVRAGLIYILHIFIFYHANNMDVERD